MKVSARIHLRLLGRFALTAEGAEGQLIKLSARKSGALLAYLAMSGDQAASREHLATLLWGSFPDHQARQSLRQALALLRKELGRAEFLAADTEMVRLKRELWSVDALEFERLTVSPDAADLEAAGRLFGGEFLAGLNIDEEGFDEWVNAQRQRMQLAASRLCETYAARPDLVSDGQQAVAVAERLMALDPLREDWQRLALTLYARYRGKNEALAQADLFAATLQHELGVAPEKETRALIERIRASETALERNPIEMVALAAASVPPAAAATMAPPPASPSEHVLQGPPDVAKSRGWTRFRLSRNVAAGLTLAAVVAIAAIGLSYRHLLPMRLVEQSAMPASTRDLPAPAQSQAAPAPDPWASPQPAEKAASTRPSGITAFLIQPFTTENPATERSTLLAEILSDDLTNMVSRIGGFRVISRQTAMTFADSSSILPP